MGKDEDNCLFCNIPQERIVFENKLSYAVFDGFPVTKYHSLIIPKRHVEVFFDLNSDEVLACKELILKMKELVQTKEGNSMDFNIGINCGKDAGQTVMHCHIHLIPRRSGDVPNPKGGVRHVIPGKGFYDPDE